MNNFKQLGLSQETIDILDNKGYTEPTEIQRKAIPMLLNGTKNIIGKSQTGTGKTAGFALPILEMQRGGKHVNTLILAPTRELAMQVKNEIDTLKGNKKISTLTVYGGSPINTQIKKLREGVDIVVGTPGRILDLIKRKVLKLQLVDYVVLDEADEMLNMGFVEDIEKILSFTKKDRQMLLFSATMPKGILKIANKFMDDYELIEVQSQQVTTDLTEQIYYDVMSNDRAECLRRVIDITDDFYGIVFCKTKVRVDQVAGKLVKRGYSAAALHGDVSQGQREQILAQFRKKRINILIATDVAARGIDVNDLTHVINYSLPQSPELYVHRIGRTGRAGKKGIAITFVIPSEKRKLKFVEKVVKQKLVRAEIPAIEDIRKIKETSSSEVIHNIILKSKSSEKFMEIADDLMKSYESKEIILALLQYGFKNQFSIDDYQEIKKVTSENFKGSKKSRKSRSSKNERYSSYDRPKKRYGRSGRRRSGNDRFDNKKKNRKTDKSKSDKFRRFEGKKVK